MPRVKIDYVVSFSSEDTENPASNLLAREVSKRKWLCKTGESSASVVLQLAKSVKISAVHIGAYNAATVEVLVGRSEKPDEPFQVLVPSSVFVSTNEARRGAAERVRSFGGAQLTAAAAQRWDRLRLVCAQPYNRHCKYGISFIHLDEPGDPNDVSSSVTSSAVPLRLFTMDSTAGSSDEDEFHPGELFAKHVQHANTEHTSTECQIRQASSQALKNMSNNASRLTKTPISRKHVPCPPAAQAQDSQTDRRRDALLYEPGDAHIDRLLLSHKEHKLNSDPAKQMPDKKNKEKLETSMKAKDRNKGDKDGQSPSDRLSKDSTTTRQFVVGKRNNDSDSRDTSSSHNSSNKRDSFGDKRDSVGDKRDGDSNKRDNVGAKGGAATQSRDNSSDEKRDDARGKRSRQPKDRAQTDDDERVGPRCSSPLRGVVFALSGYQNPERGELRSVGVRLGARYERDWTPRCTHLICAFPNTPKLKQLRAAAGGGAGGAGGGAGGAGGAGAVRAALGAWLRACAERGRRVPWRWFATEPHVRTDRTHRTDRADHSYSSERDTDDEIENVLRNQKKPRRHSPEQETPETTPATRDDHDANVDNADADAEPALNDSDVMFVKDERFRGHVTLEDSDSDETLCDDGTKPEKEEIDEKKSLPNFFDGYTFAIESRGADLLRRYVLAYGGLVVEGEADYVVCTSGRSAGGRAVSPRWVWACHRSRTLLPHN